MHTQNKRSLLVGTPLAAPAIIRPVAGLVQRKPQGIFTLDEQFTMDQMTIDSTGVFLVGELERLDQKLHMPLVNVTWQRDIDLRSDVGLGDEVSSYTNSTFAAAGGIKPGGKAWISTDSNAITGIALDIGKTANPLYLWGMEAKWTIIELANAQRAGRPVDDQKYEGLRLKHNMDTDEQVYIGDTDFATTGMVNSAAVTPSNVANGASGSPLWINKTPDEILADINDILSDVWTASAIAVVPEELRLPPVQFSYIASQKVSNAGNLTILEFVRNNCIANAINGKPLNIQPLKWLTGRGTSDTDRMMAYTRKEDFIRFPMVPLQRTPLEYRGLYQSTTYYGRLGVVELVYPTTVGYSDGI